MRLVARWGMAVAVSAAGFALAWWLCQDRDFTGLTFGDSPAGRMPWPGRMPSGLT